MTLRWSELAPDECAGITDGCIARDGIANASAMCRPDVIDGVRHGATLPQAPAVQYLQGRTD